jgi:hypothetical protein
MPSIDLRYTKDTWGSYGQHTLLVESAYLDGTFVAAWNIPGAECDDQSHHSAKNTHSDKTFRVEVPTGTLIRTFERYQSSGRRKVTMTYGRVQEDGSTVAVTPEREFRRDGATYVVINDEELCVWRKE